MSNSAKEKQDNLIIIPYWIIAIVVSVCFYGLVYLMVIQTNS